MTDLCWLPSAIMQTTGAIIGIYLFVYFYALGMIRDTLEKIEEKGKSEASVNPSYKIFFVTLLIGFITIGLNTIWLYKLIHNQDMIFPRMEFASITLFLLTLILVLVLSYFILKQGYELVNELKEDLRKGAI